MSIFASKLASNMPCGSEPPSMVSSLNVVEEGTSGRYLLRKDWKMHYLRKINFTTTLTHLEI
jgi:hypothetical protein